MKAGGERAGARPWQTVTEWHNPDLPPLETPETSDDESADESPRRRKGGRGLPPRIQEEIRKGLALVDSLMGYKTEDDRDMLEPLEGRQCASIESPKRFADMTALKGIPDIREDLGLELLVNHDGWDGNTDGDIPAPVLPTGQTGSSVAQDSGLCGNKRDGFSGSDSGSSSPAEPADMLLYYQESSDEAAEWGLEEGTADQTDSPYQYTSRTWTIQLYQIDEEPAEEPSGDECSAELRRMVKVEGSLETIKSHVDRYVNEEGACSASTSTMSIACCLSDEGS